MSKLSTNIHDAFFKRVMGEPECAGQFLREHLPPEVAALLSEDPPEPESGSFVDEDLAQHQTDLLLKVRLKEQGEALIYLLAEHKSAPDPLARLQLLRYLTRVLVHWHREKKRLPLPVVVPLIAHHGPSGWTFSTDFGDLYGGVADSLRPYLITFRHALVDLAQIDDGGLSQHLRLRAFLKALKYVLRPDLLEHLDQMLVAALSLDRLDFSVMLKYIETGAARVDKQLLRARLRRVQEKAEMFEPVIFDRDAANAKFFEACAQELKRQLRERKQIEAELKAEGKASALIQVLELRFGPLTTASRERIYNADVTSMDTWLTRAIKESTLQAVFD